MGLSKQERYLKLPATIIIIITYKSSFHPAPPVKTRQNSVNWINHRGASSRGLDRRLSQLPLKCRIHRSCPGFFCYFYCLFRLSPRNRAADYYRSEPEHAPRPRDHELISTHLPNNSVSFNPVELIIYRPARSACFSKQSDKRRPLACKLFYAFAQFVTVAEWTVSSREEGSIRAFTGERRVERGASRSESILTFRLNRLIGQRLIDIST